jgi:hypothetical protein
VQIYTTFETANKFQKNYKTSATTKVLPPIKMKSFSVAFFIALVYASETEIYTFPFRSNLLAVFQ